MTLPLRYLALAASACVLAGCSTPVPQAAKPEDVPAKFTGPIAPGASLWPNPDWWQAFGSDELSGLVTTAQTDNLDIAVAMANVLQSQANRDIARSALFPTVDLQPSAQRSRQPGTKVVEIDGKTGKHDHLRKHCDHEQISSASRSTGPGSRISGGWRRTICGLPRKR